MTLQVGKDVVLSGMYRIAGYPAVDFDEFHREELPRRLREGRSDAAIWDVADAPPLAIVLPGDRAYSYLVRDGRIVVERGVVADAETVVHIVDDDAWIDYSSSGGTTGRYPEVRTWLAGVLPAFAMRQHLVTNLEVELDGDRATSRCCLYNPMGRARSDGPVQLFFIGGTYEDELVRTPSGWRIARRTERQSWVDLRD